PVVRDLLHRGRCRCLHALQVLLVTIRISRERLAAREYGTLAAEASDTLHDSRVLPEDLRLCELQFGFGGSVLQEIPQLLIRGYFHFLQLDPRFRCQGDEELPGDLVVAVVGTG